MTAKDRVRQELEDKALKVQNAREAAAAPDASERERADLKLMEQELLAERQKAKRGEHSAKAKDAPDTEDKKLDAALKDSFPGSDPVSFLEAAPKPEPKGTKRD
ncbi:MAG: hypothetical protein ACOY71_00495 [Gemmatimonadota bacterium]